MFVVVFVVSGAMLENVNIPLVGETVTLVPIDARFEEELFSALDDERVWKWLPVAQPDAAGFAKLFGFLLAENEAGRMHTWVTTASDDRRVLGTSSFLALRPEHRGLEVGWTMISPLAWGTGANVEAKLLMMDHAFGALGCQRVEFKTDSNNERSRGALAALPAQFEGIFRRHMDTNYGVRDSAYYSVISSEWPDVRGNLEARLSRAG